MNPLEGDIKRKLVDDQHSMIMKKLQYPKGTGPKAKIAWDIPQIYAFEIETNLRKLLKDLLEPMMYVNHKQTERQAEFEQYLQWIKNSQAEIFEKLTDTDQLKDRFKESQNIAK